MKNSISAIDMHTHINSGSIHDYIPQSKIQDSSLSWLKKENAAANVEKILCSTFSGAVFVDEVEQQNDFLRKLASENDFLYYYVVIDPRNENTFIQAEKMLGTEKCVGIKIHPSNHKYTLEEFGDKIFSFAARFGAIVLIHPDADAGYILPFADKYPDVTFIMAHVGTFSIDSYINAVKNAKYANVYTDTSGRACTYNKVIEYFVGEAGSERIMFGTDMYSVGYQRGRIEYAVISDEDKENILRNNAIRLFGKFFK